MRMLELFAGSKKLARTFAANGWEADTVEGSVQPQARAPAVKSRLVAQLHKKGSGTLGCVSSSRQYDDSFDGSNWSRFSRTLDSLIHNHRSGGAARPVLFRGGLLLPFFIHPTLKRVPNTPFVIEESGLLHANGAKNYKTYSVSLHLYNESSHPAIGPYIAIRDLETEVKNPQYKLTGQFHRFLDFQTNLGDDHIPDTPEIPFLDGLAQVLLKKGLKDVERIGMFTGELFTIGFAIEGGKDFYFCSKGFVSRPIGSTMTIDLGAGAEGVKRHHIAKNPCQIRIEAWNKVRFIDANGKEL